MKSFLCPQHVDDSQCVALEDRKLFHCWIMAAVHRIEDDARGCEGFLDSVPMHLFVYIRSRGAIRIHTHAHASIIIRKKKRERKKSRYSTRHKKQDYINIGKREHAH